MITLLSPKFKLDGITKRWLSGIMSVVVVIVAVIEIVLAIFINVYYHESARSRAAELCQGFSILATVPAEEFRSSARQYIENFEDKDKLEIQIIDGTGRVIITSNGFEPVQEEMPDYKEALTAESSTAVWSGRSAGGESVMAGTTVFGDYGQGSNGAIRWVISLENVNSHVFWFIFVCVLVGLGIILFTAISGIYFVKSIVRPVQEIGAVARKIAMGDFSSRIEVQRKDEIGELCDTINYMASELSQAETVKNSFISSVSHELRTPLTAIRGWGETATMSLGSDDELVKKGLDVILGESDRLSGLVEDLLDFSRMQSGRLKVNIRPMNLVSVLSIAVDMYREVSRKAKIRLDFVCPEKLTPIMGDPDRLKQVFINVIDNAIKYSNEGGFVLVEVREEEACINIKISDTGVGIPEQDIDKVKEKFFKSNTTVRGSGIGLAVADEIMKQHNGLLLLTSKEGVGTTVTVVLPLPPKEEPEDTKPSLPEADDKEVLEEMALIDLPAETDADQN